MNRLFLYIIIALSFGCEDPMKQGDGEPFREASISASKRQAMPLWDHTQWAVESEGMCPQAGWQVEGQEQVQSLLVDTAICDPFEGRQPLPVTLLPQDQIEISLWHLNLTAPEPAMATVRIELGAHQVFEAHIPIPSAGGAHTVVWSPPTRVEAGTLWSLWIENHGGNHWRVQHARLTTCGGCDD